MKNILRKPSDKLLLSITLILLLCIFVSGCQPVNQVSGLQRIIERGYVTVGTLYGPTSYYIEAEGPTGFEYELAKKYADYLGVELVVIPAYHLDDLFPKLNSGDVDFLAAGLAVTSLPDSCLGVYSDRPKSRSRNSAIPFLFLKSRSDWEQRTCESRIEKIQTLHPRKLPSNQPRPRIAG